MTDIINPAIEAYLARRTLHRDPVLRQMEAQAEREDFPIVGPQVGQLLMLLARAIGAKRIFEMGSGFGYSAMWFAKAMPRDGRVILTDTSSARSQQARDYFAKAKQARKAEFLVGDAIELIKHVKGTFDIIFLDADKARYPLAFSTALPRLRHGGLFIADNVLWFGQVVQPHPDADTRGILEFTRLIFSTPGIASSVLPLRDGVSISLKEHGNA